MKRLLPVLAALFSLATQARADLQGAWIASVHNINFPSKQGLPVEVQNNKPTACSTPRRPPASTP